MNNLMCKFQIETGFRVSEETKSKIKSLLGQFGCQEIIYTSRAPATHNRGGIYFDYDQENAAELSIQSGDLGNYVHKKLIEISEQIEQIIVDQNPLADILID